MKKLPRDIALYPCSSRRYRCCCWDDVSFELVQHLGLKSFEARAKAFHLLLRDNRAHFRKLFGPPHFKFRGEFLFHGWRIVVGPLEYVLLTAKTKGTCYESFQPTGYPEQNTRLAKFLVKELK